MSETNGLVPAFFPTTWRNKKTSLDANGEQMFHGEIGWPETSDTRGRFQDKWWWAVKLWVSTFFFLDKSQGASDLNFNPTSTKPLGWTRNMFFWTHDLETKKSWKDLVLFVSGQTWIHGFLKKKSVLSSTHRTAVDKCTQCHQHHHDQRNSNTTCGSHKASSPDQTMAPTKKCQKGIEMGGNPKNRETPQKLDGENNGKADENGWFGG